MDRTVRNKIRNQQNYEENIMNYPDSPGLQLQREHVKHHAQNTGVNLNTSPARCGICGHGRTHTAHGPKCAKENQRRRLAGEL